MQVREIMTHAVETVDPATTLRDAARRMEELDIGALPVTHHGEPVGIVTDRDIAIRAAGEGLDPAVATVGDIMTTDLTCCRDSDDLDTAAGLMRERQVRRLLVVDDLGRLCGIVSLGDLSLRSSDDLLSEGVLEEVSAPTHPYRDHATPSRRARRSASSHRGTAGVDGVALCSLAAGAASGAVLMYLFDPQRGRRRRAMLRDRLIHTGHRANVEARKTAQYTGDRTRGLLARARGRWRHDEPSDVVLCERVRSAMGRAVSHPGAIEVDAWDGVVTLSGPVLEHEVDHLLAAVGRVRGVREVEDHLEVHASNESVPALQGQGRRRGRGTMMDQAPSPAGRLLATVAGAALTSWGVARRDMLGAGAGVVGAALAARGLSGLPADRLTGIGARRRAVDVHKTIHINAPVEAVFDFWSRLENFPRFMTNVREVRDLGGGRSYWIVAGPAGSTVEWEAQTTQYVPSQTIGWRSVEGSTVQSAGVVRFQPDRAGGTRVDVHLSYNPPGGAIGHALARAMGADPKSEMDQDLMRMKTVIETGHAPHDAARKGEAATATAS